MRKSLPKVFISYSHDIPNHKQWVASLAIKLRENGVDAVLDQWDLYPGEDVPVFMEKNLSECDYAILVCTKRYVEKANRGKGGVSYEKMIASAELVKDLDVEKFIPVIRQSGTQNVPTFIQTKMYLDFSRDEYFETVFDELLRSLFKSVVSKKPPLGTPPDVEAGVVKDAKHDELPEFPFAIFNAMIIAYDSGQTTYWHTDDIARLSGTGRIATDNALVKLEARGLLEQDSDGDWLLTERGKSFAVEIGII